MVLLICQEEKMDESIIKTKYLSLYVSTYQMGLGITLVPSHKAVYITAGILELEILLGGKW